MKNRKNGVGIRALFSVISLSFCFLFYLIFFLIISFTFVFRVLVHELVSISSFNYLGVLVSVPPSVSLFCVHVFVLCCSLHV